MSIYGIATWFLIVILVPFWWGMGMTQVTAAA
jgi:hypothetical protein